MKFFLLLLSACCIGISVKAQPCLASTMQGYRGDTTVTIDEAKRVILTSFAAINDCHEKLKLRSGTMYYYNVDGDAGTVENFTSTLDDATKLRLISKLKPGVKLMLDEMRYGDENKLVPKSISYYSQGRHLPFFFKVNCSINQEITSVDIRALVLANCFDRLLVFIFFKLSQA